MQKTKKLKLKKAHRRALQMLLACRLDIFESNRKLVPSLRRIASLNDQELAAQFECIENPLEHEDERTIFNYPLRWFIYGRLMNEILKHDEKLREEKMKKKEY